MAYKLVVIAVCGASLIGPSVQDAHAIPANPKAWECVAEGGFSKSEPLAIGSKFSVSGTLEFLLDDNQTKWNPVASISVSDSGGALEGGGLKFYLAERKDQLLSGQVWGYNKLEELNKTGVVTGSYARRKPINFKIDIDSRGTFRGTVNGKPFESPGKSIRKGQLVLGCSTAAVRFTNIVVIYK